MGFKLRDLEQNNVLVETEKPADAPPVNPAQMDDSSRMISYEFSSDFLRLKTVGATLGCRYYSVSSHCGAGSSSRSATSQCRASG